MKRSVIWDSLLLFLITCVLIAPLFLLKYLDNWPSIESTFIADGRMLRENLPHPGWQPFWYCGTRFDYIYPPALRYGTAMISLLGKVSTARAYHLYIAFFYAFGIAAVYWLVRTGNGSRAGALFSAAAAALVSPSFLLLPQFLVDSPHWVPQRLHVLMVYGEGPHISALAILPAALAASFLALREWKPLAFAAAAILCAFTVSNNFYGATALALYFPVAAWSVWVGRYDSSVWLRAAGIAALAYGLCAFWLTPSYLWTTTINLRWVALPGNGWSRIAAILAAALFCIATFRWGNRRPERSWSIFLAGAVAATSLLVLGLFYFGFRLSGEAHRLVPELDLVLLLALVAGIEGLWKRPKLRPIAVAAVALLSYPAGQYLMVAYSPFPKAGALEGQFEYRIAKWVHENIPRQRVMPSGTVRFWFDAWFDNPQADGGSVQGTINQMLPVAWWQILKGDQADLAILWLKAMGTDAVIVPDKTSLENYKEYRAPEKFRGVLPALFDDQHGTVVYRVPRIYTGIGRVIDTAMLNAAAPIQDNADRDRLLQYLAVVENPAQSETKVRWKGMEQAEVKATTSTGQSVLVQETYDSAWQASEQGKPVNIRRDKIMGFMLIEVASGQHTIELKFETPLENRVGQVLFAVSACILVILVWRGRRKAVPITKGASLQ